jgi:hypothetical protein
MTKKSKKTTWVVSYTKFIGGIGTIKVIAKDEHEAIANAKNQRHTGKNFFINN